MKKLYLLIFFLISSNVLSQKIIDRNHNEIRIQKKINIDWCVNDSLIIYDKMRIVGHATVTKVDKQIYARITYEDYYMRVDIGNTCKKYKTKANKKYSNIHQKSGIILGINQYVIGRDNFSNIGFRFGFSKLKKSKSYLYFEPKFKHNQGILKNKIVKQLDNYYKGDMKYSLSHFDFSLLLRHNFMISKYNFFITSGPSVNISLSRVGNFKNSNLIYSSYEVHDNPKPPNEDYYLFDSGSFNFFFTNSYFSFNFGVGVFLFSTPIEFRFSTTFIRCTEYYNIEENGYELSLLIVLKS